MTRPRARTDRRRGTSAVPVISAPAALGWVLALLAVFFCCVPAPAPAGPGSDAVAASAVRTITPTPAAAASVVMADAPDGRGRDSSCHGASDHSTPVVLSGPAAPVALPCPGAVAPAGPLTGSADIRGPSNDSAGDVDHLLLQVQRV